MKKIIVTFFLLGATVYSFAQAQLAIGIKAGPNFASIDTKATAGENYKSRTGFHAGAFALIKLTKIGIQPEILFSQQGSKVTVNNQNFESNFSYINIPIIIKLYTVAGINLQAGPQFGFVSKAEAPVLTTNGVTVQSVKDRAKGSDVTVALGAGWDLPFGLTIDGRYNLGLSKIYDKTPDILGSEDAKNQVWQISLGYKLIKFGK